MSYPITQDPIPGLPRNAFRHGVGAFEGVVAHATDTYGATAKNERDYESRNWKSAFVHFFVDADQIIQVASIDYIAYGAGPAANQRFVHVELCQYKDDASFKKSYDKYVWLLAWLLKRKNLGVKLRDTLWGHDDVRQVLGGTTHTDPYAYLSSHGISKDQFVRDVQVAYDSDKKEEVVKVAEQQKSNSTWPADVLKDFEKIYPTLSEDQKKAYCYAGMAHALAHKALHA